MVVINNIDDTRFSFNGVEYFKNFTPVVIGNYIRILNTYDSAIELTSAPTLYSDFEVDSVTYGSAALLQSALLPVLFSRTSLGGGGGVTPKYATLTSSQLATQDGDGFVAYANALSPNLVIASDEFYDFIVTDTGQIFKLYLSGVTVGLGQTAISINDVKEINDIDIDVQFPNRQEYKSVSAGFVTVGAHSALTVAGTQSNTSTNGGAVTLRKVLSAAVAGSSASAHQASVVTVSGPQGFNYDLRIDTIDDAQVSDVRFVYGYGGTAMLGNVNPSTYTQGIVGIGAESTDTTVQLFHKITGLGTTLNKINLLWDKKLNHSYHVRMWRVKGSLIINYRVVNLTLNETKSGSFTFDNVTSLTPFLWRNNAATATAVGFALNRHVNNTSD